MIAAGILAAVALGALVGAAYLFTWAVNTASAAERAAEEL